MKALQEADEAIAQEQDKPTLDLPSNMELSEDAQSTICTTTTSNSGEEKVYGILGLGLISQLILKQILTNGYRCIVWDIELLQGNIKLSDERISIAKTPGEVIRNSRIIFSFVDFDVKMMIYGNDGVLTSIDSTKGYVEMSHIDHLSSKEISASIEGKGARYIEAGTIYFPGILEKAQGITIMAGNRSLFDECSPLFDSTSSKIFYLGPVVGLATLEKTFISSLCNIMTSAMGESFRIVRQANLNVETFTEIAQICLNHQMERSFELLLNQQEIPLQKMIKEQQYMQREASNYLVSLPITAIATQSLLAMSDQKNVEYNRKD
ncbi:PREDICTED: glyoxylate/succinic semialdehyde reductase 1-like [Rhagoletis zephyria]|uniref:glyoxylate/succinic semialdehyde reductase 1-like n=1 Tax=Rhagoletis zephyria TaxID=28612 RepID=UPI0008115A4B|nr:PREDICTED: glyoxylate/succinic semialdehyde reductase 1-like [Rhagoletis zephyria]